MRKHAGQLMFQTFEELREAIVKLDERVGEMNSKQKIEHAFNLKVVDQQQHSWGESYWLQLDSNALNPKRRVSIITVYPNEEQKVHTHPGYEEIIFGLEGESIHWCNERQIVLKKGQLAYIPGGGQHGISNCLHKPAKFMGIIYPTLPVPLGELLPIQDIELQAVANLVNLDEITDKFAQSVRLAVTLTDASGRLIAEPKNFPEFCAMCLREMTGDCILNSGIDRYKEDALNSFRCKFNIDSVQSPIMINERLLGYLVCGYGRTVVPTPQEQETINRSFCPRDRALVRDAYMNVKFISRNHLQSVAETLSLVSVSLVQMTIHSIREQQLSAYKLNLTKEKQRQAELENSLSEVKLKLLESQVNPHFLFNTLNTIAQTSLMEGANTAASLTYALASLLRCSLGKIDSLITIKEELDYIQDYLLIQKTRFPGKFEDVIDVDPGIMAVKIPFMTLMILVENAIIHGLAGIQWQGSLLVKGCRESNAAVIEVVDNGVGVSPEMMENVRSFKKSSFTPTDFEGLGLKNIYKRLEYSYGQNFQLILERLSETGTKATVKLPMD